MSLILPLLKVMKMIVEAPTEEIGLELIALGINLALDSKCAVQMIEFSKKKGLKLLIKRAFKFKDSLIMKMVRNISQHDEVKKYFCVSNRFLSVRLVATLY